MLYKQQINTLEAGNSQGKYSKQQLNWNAWSVLTMNAMQCNWNAWNVLTRMRREKYVHHWVGMLKLLGQSAQHQVMD